MFKAIFMRCGKHLKKFNAQNLFTDVEGPNDSTYHLNIVSEYCKNIQSIICNSVSIKTLQKLSENCRNITELRIKKFEVRNELDKVLGDFFLNNKKLE